MNKPTKLIYDVLTNETTIVELTEEELASQVAPSGDEQNAPSSDTPSDPS